MKDLKLTKTNQAFGLPICVRQGPVSINGYVQLPADHPWRKLDTGIQIDFDIDVHGGVTYGVDGNGWIGFDTAHYNSGDWSRDEVLEEARRLAKQAKAAEEDGLTTTQRVNAAHSDMADGLDASDRFHLEAAEEQK